MKGGREGCCESEGRGRECCVSEGEGGSVVSGGGIVEVVYME